MRYSNNFSSNNYTTIYFDVNNGKKVLQKDFGSIRCYSMWS